MPNEKKLKRLEALLDTFDAGAIQPDELIKAIDAVMAVIDQNSKALAETMVEHKVGTNDDIKRLKSDLKEAEDNLKAVIADVKNGSQSSLLDVKASLLKEIARVEKNIPVLPPETDLSEVFEHIEEMRNGFSNLSTLILGENIRNSLESLRGEDRLDKSAIRGLDDYEEISELARSKASGAKGWASSIAKITAGTGITVDDTDPRRPIISASGSVGSGDMLASTYDPANGARQVAFDDDVVHPAVVSGNTTAELNHQYINVASATYTDPSPTEGKGFIVFVRNGTATVGGTGYSTAGTIIHRIYHSGAWANYVYQVAGSAGITRTVVATSGSVTAGSTASTDYVYKIAGAHTITLPTAVGNTNRYTFKNSHTVATTVDTTSAQTIDGTTSIQIAPEDSVDIISDGSNWLVI